MKILAQKKNNYGYWRVCLSLEKRDARYYLVSRIVAEAFYPEKVNDEGEVHQKKCKTKLERTPQTEELFRMIERAETWLKTHDYADIPLLKWETEEWGEVPADFGRK